jgi:hypothetical protein
MNLQTLLANPYVASGLSLFLALYAGLARPQLPDFIARAFENPVFRVAVLFLIAYMGNKNVQVSLMVAVAFVVTMNLLNEQRVAEGFMSGIQNDMRQF